MISILSYLQENKSKFNPKKISIKFVTSEQVLKLLRKGAF